MDKIRTLAQLIMAVSTAVIALCVAGWSIAAIWLVQQGANAFNDALELWDKILSRLPG